MSGYSTIAAHTEVDVCKYPSLRGFEGVDELNYDYFAPRSRASMSVMSS